MLKKLDIRNYAIIESLSLEFSEELNIITGETGSGKSILLGALGLILGKRVDSKVLHSQSNKCTVEGTFEVTSYNLKNSFEEEDLDYDQEIHIRREITSEGKSRAFINDTPVNLKTLQNITSQLVDLHEQFENTGINDPWHQLKMLDAFAHAQEERSRYEKIYQLHKKELEKYRFSLARQREAVKQRDYIQFQLDEIEALKINPDQDKNLESKLSELEHAGEIMTILGKLSYEIEENDRSVLGQIKSWRNSLHSIEKFHDLASTIQDRLQAVYLELEDIAYEAKKSAELTEVNPLLTEELRHRVDKINNLLHKHQLSSIEELISLRNQLDNSLRSYEDLDEEINLLKKRIQELEKELNKHALTLRDLRKKAIPTFESQVNAQLRELKMEHALFRISMNGTEQFLPHGMDDIRFLFAPNKGSEFFEIKNVASGGEMARLALITKSLVAGSLQLPTLVFDEIDSGVSGDVAKKMGAILKGLGTRHQIISITHSPQVAAKAHRHYSVFKETDEHGTKTRVRELDSEDRIREIAIMLSSSPPSAAALESAKELMHDSK